MTQTLKIVDQTFSLVSNVTIPDKFIYHCNKLCDLIFECYNEIENKLVPQDNKKSINVASRKNEAQLSNKKDSSENFKEVLQENVQQQLVQVLNTKNSNSSNKNVNVINISSPIADQKNVNVCDSLSIAKEQKCAAPKASKISNCEKISVGNDLAQQIKKENSVEEEATTCLIRETSSNSANNTSGNRREEKVNLVLSEKVKLRTNEITDGVDKLNLSDSSIKCGNEMREFSSSASNQGKEKQTYTSVQKLGKNTGSSLQNRSNLNLLEKRNKEIQYSERPLSSNGYNCNSNDKENINAIYTKSKNHLSTSKPSAINHKMKETDIYTKSHDNYRSQTLTDKYLKSLAEISADSDGKSDLQTILQRQRMKSECSIAQFPQLTRTPTKDEYSKERCSDSPRILRRVGSTESISINNNDGMKHQPVFSSLRNNSAESLVFISAPKRYNSEDNLSVFSGRYDPVDVSESLNHTTPNKLIPSSIVKARPAVVREDRDDSLSYTYDNVYADDEYPNDELYESIAGSSSDLSSIGHDRSKLSNIKTKTTASTSSSFSRY